MISIFRPRNYGYLELFFKYVADDVAQIEVFGSIYKKAIYSAKLLDSAVLVLRGLGENVGGCKCNGHKEKHFSSDVQFHRRANAY